MAGLLHMSVEMLFVSHPRSVTCPQSTAKAAGTMALDYRACVLLEFVHEDCVVSLPQDGSEYFHWPSLPCMSCSLVTAPVTM